MLDGLKEIFLPLCSRLKKADTGGDGRAFGDRATDYPLREQGSASISSERQFSYVGSRAARTVCDRPLIVPTLRTTT